MLVFGTARDTALTTSAEVYDPTTDIWTPTGSMGTSRLGGGKGVLLKGGGVLVSGGFQRNGQFYRGLPDSEVYDPDRASWSITGRMRVGRFNHTATQLADGRVLVAAGLASIYCDTRCSYGFALLGELYTP